MAPRAMQPTLQPVSAPGWLPAGGVCAPLGFHLLTQTAPPPASPNALSCLKSAPVEVVLRKGILCRVVS